MCCGVGPFFRLELPDGFRLRDGLGSNPVKVQMLSSDSLPRLFMWFASLSVDVSVPVRQVKLPLVAHSILSRARPGSMVGAALSEGSTDRLVETFLVRDVSTSFFPILFMGPSWNIF